MTDQSAQLMLVAHLMVLSCVVVIVILLAAVIKVRLLLLLVLVRLLMLLPSCVAPEVGPVDREVDVGGEVAVLRKSG